MNNMANLQIYYRCSNTLAKTWWYLPNLTLDEAIRIYMDSNCSIADTYVNIEQSKINRMEVLLCN